MKFQNKRQNLFYNLQEPRDDLKEVAPLMQTAVFSQALILCVSVYLPQLSTTSKDLRQLMDFTSVPVLAQSS